jgi:C4-dicarboxylate-specific signal transduction histidine kinase
MSGVQGHQATMGGRVSIERLIARRARLQKSLTHDHAGDKRASLQSELETIETALRSYKAALADI